MDCFEMAKDKVMMGRERRSMIISDEEKKSTAYHEAGHAIVASLTPGADPIHKVSIIPRGMALGITQQLPIDERHTYSQEYLKNNITILMGGRVAEELVRGELTTGAGNDIERATALARKMVCEWGMSDKLGPVTFGQKQEADLPRAGHQPAPGLQRGDRRGTSTRRSTASSSPPTSGRRPSSGRTSTSCTGGEDAAREGSGRRGGDPADHRGGEFAARLRGRARAGLKEAGHRARLTNAFLVPIPGGRSRPVGHAARSWGS